MCLTPDAFATHMGEFESYCPVSLCLRGELVDCSGDEQFTCVAEYKKKYYRFASKAELNIFLKDPDRFVSPDAQQLLPAKEARPISLSDVEVKSGFPTQMELQGFCPVNYKDGGCRSVSGYGFIVLHPLGFVWVLWAIPLLLSLAGMKHLFQVDQSLQCATRRRYSALLGRKRGIPL